MCFFFSFVRSSWCCPHLNSSCSNKEAGVRIRVRIRGCRTTATPTQLNCALNFLNSNLPAAHSWKLQTFPDLFHAHADKNRNRDCRSYGYRNTETIAAAAPAADAAPVLLPQAASAAAPAAAPADALGAVVAAQIDAQLPCWSARWTWTFWSLDLES